jgi:hypothetical protein
MLCRVVIQERNLGLQAQWLGIWTPPEDAQEAAFVFEDDTEVRVTTHMLKAIMVLVLA